MCTLNRVSAWNFFLLTIHLCLQNLLLTQNLMLWISAANSLPNNHLFNMSQLKIEIFIIWILTYGKPGTLSTILSSLYPFPSNHQGLSTTKIQIQTHNHPSNISGFSFILLLICSNVTLKNAHLNIWSLTSNPLIIYLKNIITIKISHTVVAQESPWVYFRYTSLYRFNTKKEHQNFFQTMKIIYTYFWYI